MVAGGEESRGGGRHIVDGVGHHGAGGVMVGTSGSGSHGVGGGSHDVGGDPVAGGGGHLGDGVCQLGGGTGAGQDEGECEARLHADAATSPLPAARSALAANIFIPLVLKKLLPQVTLCVRRGPPENGRERPSGVGAATRQHGWSRQQQIHTSPFLGLFLFYRLLCLFHSYRRCLQKHSQGAGREMGAGRAPEREGGGFAQAGG